MDLPAELASGFLELLFENLLHSLSFLFQLLIFFVFIAKLS